MNKTIIIVFFQILSLLALFLVSHYSVASVLLNVDYGNTTTLQDCSSSRYMPEDAFASYSNSGSGDDMALEQDDGSFSLASEYDLGPVRSDGSSSLGYLASISVSSVISSDGSGGEGDPRPWHYWSLYQCPPGSMVTLALSRTNNIPEDNRIYSYTEGAMPTIVSQEIVNYFNGHWILPPLHGTPNPPVHIGHFREAYQIITLSPLLNNGALVGLHPPILSEWRITTRDLTIPRPPNDGMGYIWKYRGLVHYVSDQWFPWQAPYNPEEGIIMMEHDARTALSNQHWLTPEESIPLLNNGLIIYGYIPPNVR